MRAHFRSTGVSKAGPKFSSHRHITRIRSIDRWNAVSAKLPRQFRGKERGEREKNPFEISCAIWTESAESEPI
jgi:hypothetical protein